MFWTSDGCFLYFSILKVHLTEKESSGFQIENFKQKKALEPTFPSHWKLEGTQYESVHFNLFESQVKFSGEGESGRVRGETLVSQMKLWASMSA